MLASALIIVLTSAGVFARSSAFTFSRFPQFPTVFFAINFAALRSIFQYSRLPSRRRCRWQHTMLGVFVSVPCFTVAMIDVR
jgi:hypothetical protein